MADAKPRSENMLVKLHNLDNLLSLAGEVIIASSNLDLTFRNLQSIFEKGEPINRETLDSVNDLAATTSDISSNLHHLVQVIRTLDLKDLSFRTRRLVRDISRRTGKRVIFEVEGEDTTVDKTIVEKLYDPISHQLRNAVDHGIEDSEVRVLNGKPEEGKVVLRMYNTENETFIEIEDDGAGIDMDKLKEKAIELGKITENDIFTEDIAIEVMCHAGVSTAKTITEVSGRGVGMDVVRSHMEELGGSISFKTIPNEGTIFTFRVPLISAVNIVDALVVGSGKYKFAFPISSVITTMSLAPEEINSTLGKGQVVKYLHHLLPLHDLNELLGGKEISTNGDAISVLVIEHKGENIALKISEFFSPQKLVIIPFNGALDIDGISGTTILGGRKLGFIVDVPTLIKRATGSKLVHHPKRPLEADTYKPPEVGGKNDEETKGEGSDKTSDEAKESTKQPGDADAKKEDKPDDDDLEGREEFIVEIEKILPELNEALFALESAPGDNDQINKAFRLFHTIKGNLIMMGFSKGGETVHSVESVLDRARGRKLDITAEVMDILMDGASYIEDISLKAKSDDFKDEASADILERSAKLLPEKRTEQRVSTDVASEEVRLSHEAYYRANIYRMRKKPLYRLYIEFDAGKQPSFLVACLMYKRTSELGDVLGTVPNLIDVENGFMQGKFKMLLTSEMEPEKLEQKLVSLFTRYYGATMVKFSGTE